MKRISKTDINEMNDIIMELPAFSELKSKDMIHDVLDTFMEQVYLDKPKELLDTMEFNISPKMQETFFTNYGIDKKYSKKLKGYLKEDLSYQLENLFQGKGSKRVFRIFADIFENIFRNINFYNVKVYKIPTLTGFRFEYRLDPLYITDEDNVLTHPQIPIEQTRKYLMKLENFQDYTAWPMPTNLVYIQLSIGEEVINNMNTFLDGVRSYGATYLQGKTFNYKSRYGYIEKLRAADVELITNYLRMEITKKHNPDWEFEEELSEASYLPYDPTLVTDPSDPNYQEAIKWTRDRTSFLQNMQELMDDYSNADRSSRKEMEALRRRWQFFLNLKKRTEQCYHDYDSFHDLIKGKYPLLQEDFLYYLNIEGEDSESLFDFYIYIYSIFLNGAIANPEDPNLGLNDEWTTEYIDVLFGSVFLEADFLKWYFNPVMDLFIRYFFPIEMEYINDLIQKVIIKDKWNSLSYDDSATNFNVQSRHTSLHPMPKLGLDYMKFDFSINNRHSYLYHKSMHGTTISHPRSEDYDIDDDHKVEVQMRIRDQVPLDDRWDTRIISPAGMQQRISGCVKTSGTKEYKEDILSSLGKYINIRNKAKLSKK